MLLQRPGRAQPVAQPVAQRLRPAAESSQVAAARDQVRHFARFIAHTRKALSAGPFQQAVQKAAGPGTARERMQPARDRVGASVWRRGGHRRRGQGQRGIGLALGIDVLGGAARAAVWQGHRHHACRTRVITSS